MPTTPAQRVLDSTRRLGEALDFPIDGPAYVYNPLQYAWAPWKQYVERNAAPPRDERILLVGMNPGPWGMAQTGVPFGAVSVVRDWLGIEEEVGKPENEHPKRPVEGFLCSREEVSGARLWGWAEERFKTPERFFERFFVANYCPLLFLEESGRNLTPDKLPAETRRRVLAPCDAALLEVAEAVGTTRVVAIGVWAEKQARSALADTGLVVDRILHPSPASPAANRGWADQAERQLEALGIDPWPA